MIVGTLVSQPEDLDDLDQAFDELQEEVKKVGHKIHVL